MIRARSCVMYYICESSHTKCDNVCGRCLCVCMSVCVRECASVLKSNKRSTLVFFRHSPGMF